MTGLKATMKDNEKTEKTLKDIEMAVKAVHTALACNRAKLPNGASALGLLGSLHQRPPGVQPIPLNSTVGLLQLHVWQSNAKRNRASTVKKAVALPVPYLDLEMILWATPGGHSQMPEISTRSISKQWSAQ